MTSKPSLQSPSLRSSSGRSARFQPVLSWLGLMAIAGAACSPLEVADTPPIAGSRQALTVTLTDCLPASLATAITQANAVVGPSTITLMGGCTYTVATRNNFWYGPNGLPPITNDITIDGTQQGAIIERSSVAATPTFRLFYVAGATLPPKLAGKLTLKNLTLRGGLAQGGNSSVAQVTGGGGLGAGGAIFAHGDVILSGVTLQGNGAIGGSSGAPGGAVVCGGGGGLGGDAFGVVGGGFRSATVNTAGGNGVAATEGGRTAPNTTSAGAGGTNPGGTEPGSVAANANGGAGGGTRGLGGRGAAGAAPAVGGAAGDGGGGGGARTGSGGGGGAGFGGNGGAGGNAGGGGGGAFGGGGGASAGGAGGGGGGVGGGGGSSSSATGGGAGGGGFGGGGGACLSGGNGGFGGGGGSAYGAAPAAGGTGGYGAGSAVRSLNSSGGGGLGAGGAVFVHGGTLLVVNATLTGNTATGGSAGRTAVATNRGNGGVGGGGAIFNLNGTVTIMNSTLATNRVVGGVGQTTGAANGGAVYSVALGAGTMASVALRNSILSNSLGGPDLYADGIQGASTVDAVGQNIIMSSMTPPPAVLSGTPLTSDPMLGILADNMGPAQTMALPMGSPAIGVGEQLICSAAPVSGVDERGQARPCQCDLGAFAVPKDCQVPDLAVGGSDLGGGGGDDGGLSSDGSSINQITGGGFGCSAIPVRDAAGAGLLPSLVLLGLAWVGRRRQRA
jgi:hypothetical protein